MLKKLGCGCLLAVVLAAAGIYAAWRQVTRLPDWYSEPDAGLAAADEPPADEPPGEIRRGGGRVELDERRLNDLLIRGLDEHPNGRQVRRAAKAVRASIHGDRLELGVVTSLAALAAAAENRRESEVVRRVERFAPWLRGRDFYLAARGTPRARNGHLFFGRDVELVLGGVGFDAADTAARLGVPRSELDAGAELPIPGLYVEDVEVRGGSLVLTLRQ
jgi:hypothetical protein